jgi:hypothetical protein
VCSHPAGQPAGCPRPQAFYSTTKVEEPKNSSYYVSIVEIPEDFDEKLEEVVEVDKLKKEDILFVPSLFMFQPGIGYPSSISIFMGLARLADILGESPKEENELKNLLHLLTEPGMWRIFSRNGIEQAQMADTTRLHRKLSKDSHLIKYLFAWIQGMQRFKYQQLASPLVISRTFRRFTRNLKLICDDKSSNSITNFGQLLELRIVALLNSLLIEEVILKKGILKANNLALDLLTVGNKGIGIFNQNLKEYLNEANTIDYTLAILCCPLLLMFLRETFCNFGVNGNSNNNPSLGSQNFVKIKKQPIYSSIIELENGDKEKPDKKENYQHFLSDLSKALYSVSIHQPR